MSRLNRISLQKTDDRSLLRHLVGQNVFITNSRGSRYSGILGGFRPGMFFLRNLCVVNWAGGTTSTHDGKRWFRLDAFKIEKELPEHYTTHPKMMPPSKQNHPKEI